MPGGRRSWTPEEARAAIEVQIEAHTTCLDLLDVRADGDDIAVEFAVPDCAPGEIAWLPDAAT
ncbi:MAG: hypothetical protein QOE60_1814 [Thermoleophilaceae bacterium]|nr:hypothetical protein [Thermoleophilaceae bacterium]